MGVPVRGRFFDSLGAGEGPHSRLTLGLRHHPPALHPRDPHGELGLSLARRVKKERTLEVAVLDRLHAHRLAGTAPVAPLLRRRVEHHDGQPLGVVLVDLAVATRHALRPIIVAPHLEPLALG